MVNTQAMVEVLQTLRPSTVVRTETGTALVMCQVRNQVTVLERGVVRVVERHEVDTFTEAA